MEKLNSEQMTFTDVRHLPIVKQYAKRINLVETYRVIVVHSSAHDKRRHKRIDRLLKQDRKKLE